MDDHTQVFKEKEEAFLISLLVGMARASAANSKQAAAAKHY